MSRKIQSFKNGLILSMKMASSGFLMMKMVRSLPNKILYTLVIFTGSAEHMLLTILVNMICMDSLR